MIVPFCRGLCSQDGRAPRARPIPCSISPRRIVSTAAAASAASAVCFFVLHVCLWYGIRCGVFHIFFSRPVFLFVCFFLVSFLLIAQVVCRLCLFAQASNTGPPHPVPAPFCASGSSHHNYCCCCCCCTLVCIVCVGIFSHVLLLREDTCDQYKASPEGR